MEKIFDDGVSKTQEFLKKRTRNGLSVPQLKDELKSSYNIRELDLSKSGSLSNIERTGDPKLVQASGEELIA